MSQDIVSPGGGEDEEAVLALYFEGDLALFHDYRAMCVAQFPTDVLAGDEACAAGHGPKLQSVGHSLKTVLRLLAQPGLSDVAFQIERCAHEGDVVAAGALWPVLREGLLRLSACEG